MGPSSLFTFQGKVVLCQRCGKHVFSKPHPCTTPVYAETQGCADVLQSRLQSCCQLSAQLDFNVSWICISTVIIRQPWTEVHATRFQTSRQPYSFGAARVTPFFVDCEIKHNSTWAWGCKSAILVLPEEDTGGRRLQGHLEQEVKASLGYT